MRYFILNSLLIFFCGCGFVYKDLNPISENINRIEKYSPRFNSVLYRTKVDILNNHFSGLLLIKQMPDSATRIFFSNEMGIKFFDLQFSKNGDFSVLYALEKLNKKTILKTLETDFRLLLMQYAGNNYSTFIKTENSSIIYYLLQQNNINVAYIFNKHDDNVIQGEILSKRKIIVKLSINGIDNRIADSISISHQNFHFDIGLKYIKR